MKIKVGDIVKVKGSKTGNHLIVVEMMGDVPLCVPEHELDHARIAIAPKNLIILERVDATNSRTD